MRAGILAESIIAYSNQSSYQITNLKLQKTLYFVQGYYAKEFSSPLFEDRIEHWPYGPVVPSVYFKYSSYGADAIYATNPYASFDWLPPHERNYVKKIIDKCLSLSARKLVEISHTGSPWKITSTSQEISFESIKFYFCNNDPLNISTTSA